MKTILKNKTTVFIYSIFYFVVLGVLSTSCDSRSAPNPRPRMYPKVNYPLKSYQSLDAQYCPLTLRYPGYGEIKQKKTFFEDKPSHDCWFDIDIPALSATIHCSYYPINNSRVVFDQLLTDAFVMAGEHNKRASFIDEIYVTNQHGAAGFLFKLTGPVASPYQFFMTDSTKHFLRGSLYFNTQARSDSLAPVTEFLKTDLDTLLLSIDFN